MKAKTLRGILYALWYLLAAFILFIAIVVSVLHVVTPNLNRHKPYIQQWVSKTLNMPVKIDKIEAHWDGIRPEIDLYGVTLTPNVEQSVGSVGQITLDNLHIELNLTKALFALSLQPTGIFAQGLNLHIASTGHGDLSVNNLLASSQLTGVKNVHLGRMLEWLQSQQLLVIENSNLFFKTKNKGAKHYYIKHLRLENNGQLHQLFVTVSQQSNASSSIDLGVWAHGDLTKLHDMAIMFYANFHDVALQDWWTQPIEGYQVKQAMVNGPIWLNWDNQHLQASQSRLALSGLQVYALQRQKLIPLEQFSGHVAWQPNKKGWQVIGDHVSLVIDQHPWPLTNFLVNKQPDSQRFQLGYVDLHDAERLANAFVKLPAQWTQRLKAMQPTGSLTDLTFSRQLHTQTTSKPFSFQATLNQVAILPYEHMPAASGVSGVLALQPNSGQFNLLSSNLVLDFPRLFSHSLTAGMSTAAISWRLNSHHDWIIQAKHVSAVNEDAALSGSLAMKIPHDKSSPMVSMMFGYHEIDPAKIKQYLPERFFHHSLSEWLNQAFLAGKPGSGTFVLRGQLSDYPYLNNQGIFMVDTFISDLQFEYAKGWPVLNDVDGELVFRNDSMFAQGQHATMYNTQIHELSASIPRLTGQKGGPILHVNADAAGSFADIFSFLKESPLKAILGNNVNQFSGQGPASTHLKLLIPLDHADHTQVDGDTTLKQASFQVPSWKLAFNQVQGTLHFTENGLSSTRLSTYFLGFPTTASLQTVSTPQHHTVIQVNVAGQTSVNQLVKFLNTPAFPQLSGQTAYQAQLNLHAGKKDRTPSTLTIESALKGIKIDLPAPLGKTATAAAPLSVHLNFTQHGPMNVYFNHQLVSDRIKGVLSFRPDVHKTLKLYSGEFMFGNKPVVVQQAPGLVVRGYLSSLDWKAWYTFYQVKKQQYQEQQTHPQEHRVSMIPRLVDLTIGKFSLMGQKFSPIDIKFESLLNHYSVSINSQAINGTISIPTNYPKGRLTANFVRLHLNTSQSAGEKSAFDDQVDPAALPAMQIGIADFQLGDKPMGGVYFESQPEKNAMLIKHINFVGHLLTGKVTGAWSLIHGRYQTSLSGYLGTDHLTALNKAWGVTSNLRAGPGNMRFLLSWPASPYDFSLETLDGNAVLNLGGGTVLLNNATTVARLNLGRIISLLSVDNIFTGFKGLSKKGYGFDVMHAEAGFHHGEVSLKNTYFQGPVARLDFSGEIHLVEKILNLHLTVTPHVTSSLPVIAGIATLNPLVGVATYVADKVVSPAVNSVVSRRYLIKGGFAKPTIVPLGKPPASRPIIDPADQNDPLRG